MSINEERAANKTRYVKLNNGTVILSGIHPVFLIALAEAYGYKHCVDFYIDDVA